MSEVTAAPCGFAYLFERFPSFSQTFCVREVVAMRALGYEFPVFSIRTPSAEPSQDCLSCAGKVEYLPAKYDDILATDQNFRRAARKGMGELRALWGDEEQKRRVYEALWLGPRLQAAGVGHVHTHFAGTGARTAFWLKKLFGIRYSVTAHANDIFRDEPPERLAQIFAAAEVVVTVSDFSVKFLRENYPLQAEKFVRVYNGIDTEAFPASTMPEGRPLIVGVGRYIEKKGFSDLIAACARLEGDYECQIVGCGELGDALKAQVAELNLGERVSITGPRTEGEIKELLARTRMFVLPCVYAADGAVDNLPTVIVEAMAAGVPVVSTDVAAVPEMIDEGRTGLIVSERNPEALAMAMQLLLDDVSRAREMGARGRERCREIFDWKTTSAALAEILKAHGAFDGNGR